MGTKQVFYLVHKYAATLYADWCHICCYPWTISFRRLIGNSWQDRWKWVLILGWHTNRSNMPVLLPTGLLINLLFILWILIITNIYIKLWERSVRCSLVFTGKTECAPWLCVGQYSAGMMFHVPQSICSVVTLFCFESSWIYCHFLSS